MNHYQQGRHDGCVGNFFPLRCGRKGRWDVECQGQIGGPMIKGWVRGSCFNFEPIKVVCSNLTVDSEIEAS